MTGCNTGSNWWMPGLSAGKSRMHPDGCRPKASRRFKRDHGCHDTGGAKRSRDYTSAFCDEGHFHDDRSRMATTTGVTTRASGRLLSGVPCITMFDRMVMETFKQAATTASYEVPSLRLAPSCGRYWSYAGQRPSCMSLCRSFCDRQW